MNKNGNKLQEMRVAFVGVDRPSQQWFLFMSVQSSRAKQLTCFEVLFRSVSLFAGVKSIFSRYMGKFINRLLSL